MSVRWACRVLVVCVALGAIVGHNAHAQEPSPTPPPSPPPTLPPLEQLGPLDYPPEPVTAADCLQVDAPDSGGEIVVEPGASVDVRGSRGCAIAGRPVTISIPGVSEPLATTTAIEDGSYLVNATFPADARPDRYRLVADTGRGRVVRPFVLGSAVLAQPTPAPALEFTAANVALAVLLAVGFFGLLGIVIGALVARRRRRKKVRQPPAVVPELRERPPRERPAPTVEPEVTEQLRELFEPHQGEPFEVAAAAPEEDEEVEEPEPEPEPEPEEEEEEDIFDLETDLEEEEEEDEVDEEEEDEEVDEEEEDDEDEDEEDDEDEEPGFETEMVDVDDLSGLPAEEQEEPPAERRTRGRRGSRERRIWPPIEEWD